MPRLQSSTWIVVAILCQLAYFCHFYSLNLPNAPPLDEEGTPISRIGIVLYSIPGLYADSPTLIVRAVRELQQFGHLLQRIPVLAYALWILLAIVGTGDAILQILQRLQIPLLVRRREQRASAIPLKASDLERVPAEGSWYDAVEHAVFACGVGANALSLGMLGLGLIGWMSRLVSTTLVTCGAAWCIVMTARAAHRWYRSVAQAKGKTHSLGLELWDRVRRNPAITAGVVASGAFLLISYLGAMLPTTDFDALEYHLQGPKEYFLAGRISFSSHNVYMNMPFGTEMLTLLSMVVVGDWWWGGLVGQTVLASFAPITALGIAMLGRRCFGSSAGWLGALLYLSTPWVYRIAVIPHTENALAFFLLAALLAVRRAIDERENRTRLGNWFLAGVMAGSAAGCKYTALTSTVAPIGLGALLLAAWHGWQNRSSGVKSFVPGPAVAVALGVLLAVGPWFIRNAVWTGNPTYPLLYNLFGGRNWTPEKNTKWEWGHRVALFVALGIQHPPPDMPFDARDAQHAISFRQLAVNLHDVTFQSDWLSPLLYSLAPLALAGPRGRRSARWMWLLVAFLFLQWWLLTNRYDRFWVPMLPVVAVLAGGGCVWCDRAAWRIFLSLTIPVIVWLNLCYCTTTLCGYNLYGMKLTPRSHPLDTAEQWIRDKLPPSARILAVGEAAFFHLDRDVIYNTVFDDCLFAEWLHDRSPAQFAAELQRRGITHILVNWSAIHGHRSPGGYGYSPQATPARFQELVARGVLQRLPIEAAELADFVSVDGINVAPREAYAVVRP